MRRLRTRRTSPLPRAAKPPPRPRRYPGTPSPRGTAPVEIPPEVLKQAAEITGRLDLARLDTKPKQAIQITHALAEALIRPDADAATVERYAAATIAGCRTVKYLLGAFERTA